MKEYNCKVTYDVTFPIKVYASDRDEAEQIALHEADNINPWPYATMLYKGIEISDGIELTKVDLEGE